MFCFFISDLFIQMFGYCSLSSFSFFCPSFFLFFFFCLSFDCQAVPQFSKLWVIYRGCSVFLELCGFSLYHHIFSEVYQFCSVLTHLTCLSGRVKLVNQNHCNQWPRAGDELINLTGRHLSIHSGQSCQRDTQRQAGGLGWQKPYEMRTWQTAGCTRALWHRRQKPPWLYDQEWGRKLREVIFSPYSALIRSRLGIATSFGVPVQASHWPAGASSAGLLWWSGVEARALWGEARGDWLVQSWDDVDVGGILQNPQHLWEAQIRQIQALHSGVCG